MPRTVLHPVRPRGVRQELQRLAERGAIELVVAGSDDEVAAALAEGAQVLVSFRWQERFLTPSLRWVASISAGFEQFPLTRLREQGVALTTASGVNAVPVAEHAMALLLACSRRIDEAVQHQRERRWQQQGPRLELEGSTLAIVGMGAIGERVAELGHAFGMRVLGVKRDPLAYAGCAEAVVAPDGLLEVCAEADVLIGALPGGAATRGLLDAEVFDALDGGWFVNVGRGSTVDEAALVAALESGRVAGAGLDVVAEEPLAPTSVLWSMPGVVITPHVAGLSPAYGRRFAELFTRNLAAYEGTAAWTNRVV